MSQKQIPPAPWTLLPPAEELSTEDIASEGLIGDLYPILVETFRERFGGHWLSSEGGELTYNVGLVDGTAEDAQTIESLRAKNAPDMRLPVLVRPVPLSQKELGQLFDTFTAKQAEEELPPNLSVESRIDLGSLVVGISQTASADQVEEDVLTTMGEVDTSYPDHILFFVEGTPPDATGRLLDRGHIPPYRGGKYAFMRDQPATASPDCTTNFVWEDDDSGPVILPGRYRRSLRTLRG